MPHPVRVEPVAVGGPSAQVVSRRVHQERVLLAGWGRAILLQLAHPLVACGVAEHSRFSRRPREWLRRLDRTLHAMLALTFGSADDVAATAARINGIHDRVHGPLGKAAGGLTAGARYSAHDPALLAWVHATLIDSFLLTYRRFVGPLDGLEADRYCSESSGVEAMLEIPAGRLPRTEAELRRYLADTMASGAIEVTDTARALARQVLAPPVPWLLGPVLQPLLRVAALPAVGLLPPAIREAYGLPWSTGRERALRLMTASSRAVLPLVPGTLRYWPAARRGAQQ
ncbi:MAG TPA: oxygenase MpaB family protein [Candidatus Bathyarchaeia archaeon]|nr:oxygenase MpaB family protein [Candidatus Bathyarchaeia archaeon]